MRSLSTLFRWFVIPVWGLVLIPVLVDLLKKWLDRNGAAEHAGEWVINAVAGIANLPGFYPALYVLSGLLVGIWLDAILRRFDGSRAAKLEGLGYDLRNLGGRIRDRQNGFNGSWPGNCDTLKPALLSLHLRLNKQDIWSPGLAFHSRSNGAQWLASYLELIGTLLTERHFAEAKEQALAIKQSFEEQGG